MTIRTLAAVVAVLSAVLTGASAQEPQDPKVMIAAQKVGMAPLAYMDGVWRGEAWTILASGDKHTITQTERIGPFLDGSLKVIEGKGYDPDGKVTFNAFAIISYDTAKKIYTMRSYAQGRLGDFEIKPTAEGFVWEIPAGPMIIRYTAMIKDGKWKEVGDRILPGKEPVRFFEMNLKRIGNTEWPASNAVKPKD
ncbi:MAG: DUF1579 domain-containing protein [Chthonomonadales bacterium]